MTDLFDRASERTDVWEEQAQSNIEKWGLQDVGMLLLAVAEENGEIAQEAGDVVDAESPALATMLDMTATTGLTIRDGIERVAEDEDGNPRDDRPTFALDEDANLDAIQEEVDDLGALLIQLQTALENARIERDKH